MHAALADWAGTTAARRPRLLRVGYFGSYARGDWGVGSDLDVVLVVTRSDRPFMERGTLWDLVSLPVPVQLLAYTRAEWMDAVRRGDRFARVLNDEVVWVHG